MKYLAMLLLLASCAAPPLEQRRADYLAELNRDRAELGHSPLEEIPNLGETPDVFLWYHIWYSYNPSMRYAR